MKLRKGDIVTIAVEVTEVNRDGSYMARIVGTENRLLFDDGHIQMIDQTMLNIGDWVEGQDIGNAKRSGVLEYISGPNDDDRIGLICGMYSRYILSYDTIKRIERPADPATEHVIETTTDKSPGDTYYVQRSKVTKGCYDAVRSDGEVVTNFTSVQLAHDWVRANWSIDRETQRMRPPMGL